MEKSLPRLSFWLLLGLIVGFILLSFVCRGDPVGRPEGGRGNASPLHFEPALAATEAPQEQTADYTIAFSSLAPWDLDVFIANADGSSPRPLASHPDLDYNAAFSPDGQWIVFTSHRNSGADLYRIHPDGSGLQRLTDHPAFDAAAAFSPDGSEVRALTDDQFEDGTPGWAPLPNRSMTH